MSLSVASPSRRTRGTQRGFTLTEAAIVLGVIGLILAGIWFLARQAQERATLQGALNLVLEVNQNASDYASATAQAPAAPTQAQLVTAGLYPGNVRTTPFGGTSQITLIFPEANRRRWSIAIAGIPNPAACARLLALLPANRVAGAGTTTAAAGLVGIWPTVVPAAQDNQGGLPTHSYLRGGAVGAAWQDVTGATSGAIATTANAQNCTTVAFHFMR